MDTRDVAVVGAGPAGTTAARLLAARGHDVVLFEAARVGRDKPCGGGLTARARAELPAGVAGAVRSRINAGEVRAGTRTRQRFALRDGAVWMVCRAEFDRYLAESAMAQGVDLHQREAVRHVARDGEMFAVHTTHETHRARILLIASGGESRLGAALGLTPPLACMAPALEIEGRARSRHLDPHAVVFDYAVPRGYAWAFPKGDVWNVGVLTTRSHPGPTLRRHLDRVVTEWGIDFDGCHAARAAGRRIPMWPGRAALHAGRAALLGDAAALADPFFGEGIAGALLSGRLAATASDAVLSGRQDDLASYSRAVDAALRTHMRRARLAARLVYAQPQAAARGLRLLPPLRAVATALATEPFAATV